MAEKSRAAPQVPAGDPGHRDPKKKQAKRPAKKAAKKAATKAVVRKRRIVLLTKRTPTLEITKKIVEETITRTKGRQQKLSAAKQAGKKKAVKKTMLRRRRKKARK